MSEQLHRTSSSIEPPEVHGVCDARFELVREDFVRNFTERGDVGAAAALVVEGETVVDLWAGWQDAARTSPWQAETLAPVWSVGKGISALAVLRLVDAGLVDLDAPVARYWPEFAQAGKERVPVRMLLAHQAGLSAIEKPLPPSSQLTSWETMVEALAEQRPWWEPGEGHGYHVNTIGFLLGELVRRVTGKRLREVVREEIAAPLGAEFPIGTAPEDDERTAEWLPYVPAEGETVPERRPWLNVDPATASRIELMRILAYRNPPTAEGDGVASRRWRAAEFPSTNPHSNARSIARIFGALGNGGEAGGYRLLSPELVEQARTVQSDGEDLLLMRPTRFGLGFQLTIPGIRPLGPNAGAFGHYGNGAILGFADPVERLGFAYVCNQSGRSWRDPRNIALIDRLYESLGYEAGSATPTA